VNIKIIFNEISGFLVNNRKALFKTSLEFSSSNFDKSPLKIFITYFVDFYDAFYVSMKYVKIISIREINYF
jgi:hypothetical protein